MIKELTLHNFKRFKEKRIKLNQKSITLLVGGNNSGKSTIIHALAIWEFCKLILSLERGQESLLMGYSRQGVGISADEFLPIAIPSLKHLWTNLKPQKTAADPDGYTLKIGCKWDTQTHTDCYLELGMSLVNDRLFIKATNSNLSKDVRIPNVAFMPTFAGILEKEQKVTFAERRKQIGKGLAGSVIRNMIYELFEANVNARERLKGNNKKIETRQLAELRKNDPFEILQDSLRKTFSTELKISRFNELYNTHLKIESYLVEYNQNTKRYQKVKNYNVRDIMVQGNGFLQWLAVFSLALNSDINVLLLDEPDAHLHNTLQREMLKKLQELIPNNKSQILIATHSSKIIKEMDFTDIFSVDRVKYLTEDNQKQDVLLGLGSEYLPYIDKAKLKRKILFLENESDRTFLSIWSDTLRRTLPDVCFIYGTESHSERFKIFSFLKREIPSLRAISLRDLDAENPNTVHEDLSCGQEFNDSDFKAVCWKRTNIENYLLLPQPVSRAAGANLTSVSEYFSSKHGLMISSITVFTNHTAANALLRCDGKTIITDICNHFSCNKFDVAKNMTKSEICEDILTIFELFDLQFNLPGNSI